MAPSARDGDRDGVVASSSSGAGSGAGVNIRAGVGAGSCLASVHRDSGIPVLQVEVGRFALRIGHGPSGPVVVSRAAAKHTTVAERKCTTGVMPEGADLGVGVATGTVVGGPWEDYGPACSGAEDSVAFCRLPLRR